MIIKKIILNNIRSYKHEEISFNEGSTLLVGDIGSGKTSVLLAIEFGLFGLQPGQRGSILLRHESKEGGVKLIFEIDKKEIIIERTLKRGKSISQDYSSISVNGIKEELSITELKSKILSILNYPQEFSKKQNILYKFTVYTPQEEMKQIILQDSETRLNTLRYVFGIDKYRRILENANILRLKIREERRLLEGATSNLDSEEELLLQKEVEADKKNKTIFELTEDVLLKAEERKEKEIEKEKIFGKIKENAEIKAKLGQATGLLHSKIEIFTNNKERIKILEEEIQKFKLFNFKLSDIQELEDKIFMKKKQKEKLNTISINIHSELASLNSKFLECKKLEKQMQNLETCPTCHQKVDSIYRANVLNKNYNELSKTRRKIEEIELDKNGTIKKINELEVEINLLGKKSMNLKILKMKLEIMKENENKINEIKKSNYSFDSDVKLLEEEIEILKSDLLSSAKYDNIYKDKSKELELALREEKMSEIKLAEAKKEIEVYEKSIEELRIRIEKIKEIKIKLNYFTELETWINRKFIPLISFIERNVMISLKYEFSKLFSEWFNILVPENFSVKLSDNFTPLIEQKDYEIDYNYLSGGERTAIALAYRLSLNQIINSLMSKIKTKDLVILDEPTDGFSSEQLDKIREVLDQLNVKQLIIVSHEQKIENFVENVIKFKKEYGISKKIFN